MVFDHKVKYNGVWYMPGEEIKNEVDEKKTSTLSDIPKYTKTDINRMNVESLRQLAKENNVPNVENMTGQDLKTYLITLFEL